MDRRKDMSIIEWEYGTEFKRKIDNSPCAGNLLLMRIPRDLEEIPTGFFRVGDCPECGCCAYAYRIATNAEPCLFPYPVLEIVFHQASTASICTLVEQTCHE